MLKGGISDPRNKALMKMFNMIGIGERAGSGVPDIYSVWKSQGWVEPQVIEEYAPDRTILKLSFVPEEPEKVTEKSGRKKVAEKSGRKKVAEKTKEQMFLILDRMQPGNEYKVAEVAEWLGVGRTRTQTLLKLLIAEGEVLATGATKMKRYMLTE